MSGDIAASVSRPIQYNLKSHSLAVNVTEGRERFLNGPYPLSDSILRLGLIRLVAVGVASRYTMSLIHSIATGRIRPGQTTESDGESGQCAAVETAKFGSVWLFLDFCRFTPMNLSIFRFHTSISSKMSFICNKNAFTTPTHLVCVRVL